MARSLRDLIGLTSVESAKMVGLETEQQKRKRSARSVTSRKTSTSSLIPSLHTVLLKYNLMQNLEEVKSSCQKMKFL